MAGAPLKTYVMALDMIELVETKLIDPEKFALRTVHDEITSLMLSIRSKGLLQPIVVRPSQTGFELVAGHRRFTACRRLGWVRVPCIVKELNDREAFELALVENVQRQTLDPIDEAKALQRYVLGYGWGGVTDVAKKIGKSEEYVSHRIALLSLPQSVLEKVSSRQLSASCAYELRVFKEPTLQEEVATLALENKMKVRGIRKVAKLANKDLSLRNFIEAPGFSEKLGDYHEDERGEPEVQQAITTLRMCMIRLDALLRTMKEGNARSMIQKMRLNVHTSIDDLIRFGI